MTTLFVFLTHFQSSICYTWVKFLSLLSELFPITFPFEKAVAQQVAFMERAVSLERGKIPWAAFKNVNQIYIEWNWSHTRHLKASFSIHAESKSKRIRRIGCSVGQMLGLHIFQNHLCAHLFIYLFILVFLFFFFFYWRMCARDFNQ